ncbi:MAG: zinc ribbon domain-containing protein, partial [Bacteroidales bacterium]|nr:zinc ribbon domain-containing protein [Bacteroidales bacterium]
MNCPKCNAVIADGHRFCTECGYKVVEESAPVEAQAPVAEPEPVVENTAADMNDVDNHIMW